MAQISFSIVVVCLNPGEKLLKTVQSVLNQKYGNYEIVVKLSLIHISEPTRLGMISYAVFCLKKKNR